MPSICVTSVRQLFNDGNHNAFTDLCRFRNRLFLTFRSCPDGHMLFTSSRIVVLSSSDGTDWEQVHAFSVANRDVRDPHFLVFDGKLFVYSGAWWVNPDDGRRTGCQRSSRLLRLERGRRQLARPAYAGRHARSLHLAGGRLRWHGLSERAAHPQLRCDPPASRAVRIYGVPGCCTVGMASTGFR